jgi:hypothetical protein
MPVGFGVFVWNCCPLNEREAVFGHCEKRNRKKMPKNRVEKNRISVFNGFEMIQANNCRKAYKQALFKRKTVYVFISEFNRGGGGDAAEWRLRSVRGRRLISELRDKR